MLFGGSDRLGSVDTPARAPRPIVGMPYLGLEAASSAPLILRKS